MAADTTTPLLQLLLQATGNNNNAWGQNLNDQVITPIEDAIAGIATVAVTGAADVALTATQSRYATILLTGTLTANQTIIVPSSAKRWNFLNNCTGSFYVLLKTAAGNPVTIPAGKFTGVICDGTQVYREDGEKVGEYFYHAGQVAPSGAIECRGGTGSRVGLVSLFNAIGTTHGAGDGFSTFGLPDGYTTGRFLRARTATVTAGTYQSNQNKSHTHTGSGTTGIQSATHAHFGAGTTAQENVLHTHTGSGVTGTDNQTHYHTGAGNTADVSNTHTHVYSQPDGISSTPGGGFEAVARIIINAVSTNNTGHTHAYSFSSSNPSNLHNHSYSFTTATESVGHTHSYSFTTNAENANHTHDYSFTTSTGSADGTEARPEAIVGILCVRY